MTGFDLPKTLLLGSATAATQIEGGDVNNNWYAWSLAGRVGHGESSLQGADHWNRVEEDIELMASLHQECYRMSIEWSRIEPRPGEWSSEGLAHYRNELELLVAKNIKPHVSLHHFSCPQWFQERGGWLAPDAVDRFLAFATRVVEAYADLVSDWSTINEPNVLAMSSYVDGIYPPGARGDFGSYFRAVHALIEAHCRAYGLIHSIRDSRGYSEPTRVGFAHHVAVFAPASILAAPGTAISDYSFHKIFFAGFVEGRLLPPVGAGHPFGKGRFCDYIGINYYSRHLFKASPRPVFATPGVDRRARDLNDLGWEIYPQGLFQVCMAAWKRYGLPIHITENGIPDAKDARRQRFIYEHLAQVRRLLDEGAKVERYFYWSLLDNLEWNDGYDPRFGLVEIDYATMKRLPRKSAFAYADVCATRHVPSVV
jgi:Beta-glucosidase/6-phospho-beta-glucosidase/beta-galactosidase